MKETLNIEKKREVLSLITGITFSNVPSWYGATRRDLKMDLIVPKAVQGHKPCPCIIWVCGGAYMVVDRSVWMPELMRFAEAGYVVASIEYRTSNEACFPAPLIDVKSAIRYLRTHAAEYCIDPKHIFIMGESAGGTMACLAGTTAGIPDFEEGDHLGVDSSVQGIVDFYGITEVSRNSCNSGGPVPPWAMDSFLGVNFTPEQAAKASALSYVSNNTPPVMILHGTADPLIPVEQSQKFYDLLKTNGIKTDLLIVNGAAHGDDLFYQDEVINRILHFLNQLV